MNPLDRHKKIALSFSGGKDSLACVYLLRPYLDRMTIYHLDTGDLLPEMRDSVARVEAFAPHFVRVETNVTGWIAQHGLPTDLLPYWVHPVAHVMGETRVNIVPRYDCCYQNLMAPLFQRVCADGNTLMIRGTKRVDMPRLPVADGDVADGVEFYYPLQDWTNDQVMKFLRDNDVPIPRLYEYVVNSPECARCPAWWNEKRAAYLRKFHPALFQDYAARLRVVAGAVSGPLGNLMRELQDCEAPQ